MEQKQNAIEVEGKTLELALQKAALTLGVSQERFDYEVLKETGTMMSLFTGKRVQIKAWRKLVKTARVANLQTNHRRDRDSSGNRDRDSNGGRDFNERRPSRPNNNFQSRKPNRVEDGEDMEAGPRVPQRVLSDEEVTSLRQEIAEFWSGICSRVVGHEIKVQHELQDGRLILTADDEVLADHFEQNVKLAEAFEHLLRKKPRHLQQELPFRVFVDVNGFRKKREEELVLMAKDLSFKVFENKKPIVLNYRSPYERKIIHMALDGDERVYTKSIGSGPSRKLMILPISERESDQDSEHGEDSESNL